MDFAYGVQVEDPSKYGVVVTDSTGQVERFVEKPKVRQASTLYTFRCFSGSAGTPGKAVHS